jgi:CheY-like chemotaxis protein
MDPSQVDQVLVNLAVNARDAMPGGGRLAFGTHLERQNGDGGDGPVAALPPGEYVVLTVADTGEGMDPVTRQHAFEPFFTTKPKGKGTGLGLATVYGIVKQNSGFIDVESEQGAGTTFRISLPKVAGAAEEERAEGARAGPARGSATVLLVEDEPAVRGLVRHVLSEHGYSVLEAPESNKALALFEEHDGEIDLLITDLVLPGLSGDALAARIAEARPDLPTLFISGYSETFLGERGVVREGVRLLSKPFEARELLERVEELLRAPAAHAAR